MAQDDIFHAGERFHGYIVLKPLGMGGVGAVYLVQHEVLDQLYALKVLYPETARRDPTFVKRFLREARLATRIHHPNLVAVHDCGHDAEKDVYYLVMDYVAGGSLRTMLALGGKMAAPAAARVIAQVASALQSAQPLGVVHRDIKPENIMVRPDGVVKLVDLGIAKATNLGDSLRTKTDSVFGTPAYVSPEQAQNSSNVDVRADIYSLGIVFFEMLAGRCPYVGQSPARVLAQILSDDPTPDVRDFVPDVAGDVAVLVRRMTMKDLSRRLPSFDAVLAELAKLGLEGVDVTPPAVPATSVPTRPEPGMKTLMEGLDRPAGAGTAYDPLQDPDESIRAFALARARRRRQKRLLILALAGALAAVTLAALLLL